jgi:hypothetical protein
MLRYRHALSECRARRADTARQRERAQRALTELDRQYRAAPSLPLAVAALSGFLLGRHRPHWRPPRRAWALAWRGGLHVLRGML